MNRFVSEGLITEMCAGKRVLVLSENMKIARAHFQNLVRFHSLPDGAIIRKGNGKERIEFGSGSIRFVSVRLHPGWLVGDVIFVDSSARGSSNLIDLFNFFAAQGAEIIRA